MLTDNMPDSLEDKLSNGEIPGALADPDVSLKVILCISDAIHNEVDINEDTDLAPYRQRLATSVQWMQQRHADFAGEVELSCI
jgi:hypothetical protein